MMPLALAAVLLAAQENVESKVLPLLEARCFRGHRKETPA